jgi:hypothetical protein
VASQFITTGGNRHLKQDGSGRGTVETSNVDVMGVWKNDTFGNDHFSEIVTKWTGPADGTGYIYLLARAPNTDNGTTGNYYFFWSDGGSDTALLSVIAGSGSTIATANATTFTSGTVFRLTCSGSTISVTKNGSNILSVTDSAVSVRDAVAWAAHTTSTGTTLFDDWQGE